MTLANAMTKNHLHSDDVVLAQGGERVIPAGTVVIIPANSNSPSVSFATTRELIIADGDAEGTVNVVAQLGGDTGNAAVGAIKAFSGTLFPGATVKNNTAFRSGRSVESDEDLRQRIKNHPATLSRGTDDAITAEIQGATDSESGRSIQSVSILPPVSSGDAAQVIIDDNTGLEPRFDNQPSEELIKSASGQEDKTKTKQFPVTSSC